MVQLSHLYMTSGKTIPLTIQIFVSKVMSLVFNMLSMFVIILSTYISLLKRAIFFFLIEQLTSKFYIEHVTALCLFDV